MAGAMLRRLGGFLKSELAPMDYGEGDAEEERELVSVRLAAPKTGAHMGRRRWPYAQCNGMAGLSCGGLVSVHPALAGLAALALILGEGRTLAVTALILALHEAAHILCARALAVPIKRLRLTPLGAALELDMRLVRPWQEVVIALAGPMSGMAAAAVMYLLMGRGLNDALLAEGVGIALALTLFNLLPASPLDGGRVLHGLARSRLGERRADDICGALGMLMSIGLMAAVLASALRGVLPLMLMAAAFNIYVLAAREYRGDAQTAWQLAWTHRDELERGGCLPVRVIAVDAATPARRLLGRLRAGKATVFRVTDESMQCLGELSEAELISRCMDNPNMEVRQMLQAPV